MEKQNNKITMKDFKLKKRIMTDLAKGLITKEDAEDLTGEKLVSDSKEIKPKLKTIKRR